jgi:competence protein comEA helix-hairpin-helix repeat region
VERQEKGGSTYFFLALVTLAFLAAVLYLTFGANRTEQEGYTVQTERPAREEEIAPVRVLVNINTATAEELETVTGIGPVLAQAILDYRAEHGDFQTLDELLEVRGIGSAKLDAMRDEITTGGDAP